MAEQATRPDPWTPERARLRAWFHDHAPRLEAPYEAAVRLLHEPDFPARRHLLAHLVREIAEGLPEVVTGDKIMRVDTTKALGDLAREWSRDMPAPSPFERSETPPAATVAVPAKLAAQVSRLVADHERVTLNRRDKFALLMEALRPGSEALRPALEPVIRQWVDVARWFQGQAHVRRDAEALPADDAEAQRQAEAELQRQFRHFEDGLHGILAGHFDVTHEIDAILASSPPGADTLKRLMPLLGGREQLKHFFEHIQDPAWLAPLEHAGFFEHAPGAVVRESEAGTSTWYPDWPAAKFLVRVAGHEAAQEPVTRIACDLRDNENPWVQRDVADVAHALAPPLAARLVPRLVKWLAKSYVDSSQLDDKLGALAARLAEGGERAEALELLRKLTDKPVRNRRGEPTSLEPYGLGRILRRDLPAIIGGLGLEGFTVVCQALDAELRSFGEDAEPDRSAVWRPAVERDGPSTGSMREVLVQAVVRAGEVCLANGTVTLPDVVERLEARRAWIFRRIALYLLASTPDAPTDLLAARLLDRSLFEAFDRLREYRLLLQHGFARLTSEEQQHILAWIDTGPGRTEVRGFLERWATRTPADNDVAHACRRWQWRRLVVVQADLTPEWRERLTALEQEFEIAEADAAIDLPVWPVRDERTASPRELPDEMVRAMPTGEIAARLRAPWAERSRDPAFVSEFQLERRVKEEPWRDVDDALAFKGCPPEVVAHFFWGLRGALHERRRFEWSNVLRLASWALHEAATLDDTSARAAHEPAESLANTHTGWDRTRSAVVELIEMALRIRTDSLTLDDRAGVWRLLDVLAQSSAAETRAQAVELIAFYRGWLEAVIRQPGAVITSAPEVTSTLSAMLDATPAPQVHKAFGRRMEIWTLCERAWLEQHVDRIFPAADRVLFEAAWSAYLHEHKDYAGRLASRFAVLRHVYARALETMKLPGITGNELMGATEPARAEAQVLARDLLSLYGAAVIDLDDPLLTGLFERADGRLRLQALFSAGNELLHTSADTLVRFRTLWCWRCETIKSNPSRADELCQELPAFGSWFIWGDFDEEWKLDQLDFVLQHAQQVEGDTDWWEPVRLIIEVLRRLTAIAARMPKRAVNCLALLADRLKTSAQLRPDEVNIILAAALRSGDPTAQAQAIETFHRLGSLGFRAHELLPFSNDLDDPATIAYFTWDHPMTVAEIRKRLTEASEPERNRMLGQILREAKDTDVWKFTTPEDVDRRWPQIERHLGRRREFWQWLRQAWKDQGLLAG